MDIQRWLNGTAEADPPLKSIPTSGPDFSHRPEKVRPVFKQRRVRTGTKSDSSLLDPHPHSHTAPKKPKQPSGKRSDESTYSEASRPSRNSSAESESSQPYARKPRRKTRPERYQPKQPKERGRHVHQSRKDKSKRSKRKSKGNKDEKPDSGVAQTFHAKNVSRDRLTLQPRESLGIFNKGRTSTAVRGRGLPDLVFSEMKFLQKEKLQPDPEPQQSAPKKKRKKDHAHDKEGEISAFFTSVRPALAETDGSILTHKVQKDCGDTAVAGRRERGPSTKSSGVVPTTEMPAKGSYLGFGGRGPGHESTSYVSWSESVHASDTTVQHPKPLPATDHNRDKHFKHRGVDSIKSDVNTADYNHPASPSLNDKRRGGSSTERFRISSVPSQQRMSRSHSYPQHTSSPRKVNLVDRAAKFQSTESVASPSSMPPYAPVHTNVEPRRVESRVRPRLEEHEETDASAVGNAFLHQQGYTDAEVGMDDEEGETSSDLGRVIQECNHKFREQRRTPELHERHQMHYPRQSRPIVPAGVSRRLSVRFAGVEMRSPRVPIANFPGASIYEQQAQREQVPLQTVLDEECFIGRSYLDEHEHELAYQQDDMAYDEQNWDEQFEEPWFDGEDPDAAMVLEPSASIDMVQRSRPEDSVVAPGFWRPNRLY